MAKFRMVHTDFWNDGKVIEDMTPEDKFFFLYLLTNPNTTQIGIYQITKKQIAFDMGYSIESVNSLMNRFIEHHGLIRYNPDTRELAVKNWGKYNLVRGGKPILDCIKAELKEVKDITLIKYVGVNVPNDSIRSIYELYYVTSNDTSTLRGEKEEEEKEQQQEKEEEQEDVREIINFWDNNGFGLNNMSGKERLLSWLDDSKFKNPKEMILKALEIACSNNKRYLKYVEGILRNWENESLLTLAEVEQSRNNSKPGNKKPRYDPKKDRF